MRKAFTLIEVLVVIAVLPFVLLVIGGVYTTFIRDIPRTTRVLQVNTTVLNLLGQMRRDVDAAVGLPEQFEGQRADERTLLIEQPGQVIRYQIEEGRLVRTPLVVTPSGVVSRASCPRFEGGTPSTRSDALAGTLQAGPPSNEPRVWRVPDAVIAWRLWQREGKAYAVEIHSQVKQRVEGRWREKLANTQVFFVHGFAEEGEIR
jgi:prepilin-type N-terminal cleavage/methylation domain-containing protein